MGSAGGGAFRYLERRKASYVKETLIKNGLSETGELSRRIQGNADSIAESVFP